MVKYCAPIFSYFEIFICAPIVAPPTNGFQICYIRSKGFSSSSKSACKCRRYVLLKKVNYTYTETVDWRQREKRIKSEKHLTLSSHTDWQLYAGN